MLISTLNYFQTLSPEYYLSPFFENFKITRWFICNLILFFVFVFSYFADVTEERASKK